MLEKDAFLKIRLIVKEQLLHFHMENNFNATDQQNSIGIGLENVQRRLSLIYPNTHELQITNSTTVFCVDLKLYI